MAHIGSLYDQDFAAWAEQQAAALRLLREGARPNVLDVDNLIEEVEGLASAQRSELGSRLRQVMAHLLKLRGDPDPRPRRGWQAEIDEHRASIEALLDRNPSLRPRVAELAASEWARARRLVVQRYRADYREQVIAGCHAALPEVAFFDLDAEVLAEGWYPSAPEAD